MNPQYTNVKVDSSFPTKGQPNKFDCFNNFRLAGFKAPKLKEALRIDHSGLCRDFSNETLAKVQQAAHGRKKSTTPLEN